MRWIIVNQADDGTVSAWGPSKEAAGRCTWATEEEARAAADAQPDMDDVVVLPLQEFDA